MFKSIRHGLFAALAGFTVFICLCYTGLTLIIAYVTEDMLIDRLLQREAASMVAQVRLHGKAAAPANDLIRAYDSVDGLPPPVREAVQAGRQRAEIFTGTGLHFHLRTLAVEAPSGPQRIYLVADVGPLLVVSKLVGEVGGVVAAVAVGLIALALLLAYLLSRRLVAPLQQLAREVRDIRPGAPVELGARQRRDEIGYLADKLGTTIAELHAALAREHAFTRDVSHELRTPLTVMKNTFVQAGSAGLGTREIAQLRAGVDEIGATIDVLFALARAEQLADERFDLRVCVEECLLRMVEDDWTGDRLALDLPDRLEVFGNRHLSTLLLNNCLGNALFHGGPDTRLALAYADGRLVLKNSIDPAATAAMQGFLHGQNLLQRIAAAMGWEVQFHSAALEYRVDIVPRQAH